MNLVPPSFYTQPTLTVARQLLGLYLVRVKDGKEHGFMITEVEAYDGPSDKASHASRGKTPRNEIMFGVGGYWYVYLCYGVHWMLNIVTGKVNYPAAVLIRGVEGINGPGRVTKALAIDQSFNKKPAARKTGLWIKDRGICVKRTQILQIPRIGVHYAGDKWSKKPYRFVLPG